MGRYALIVVVSLIFILTFFIITTNRTSLVSLDRNLNSFHNNQAKNIANSAAQIAVYKIAKGEWELPDANQDYFFTSGADNFEQWDEVSGSSRLRIVRSGDYVTVYSTGRSSSGDVQADYKIEVSVEITGSEMQFDTAVFSESTIDLTGSAKIVGNAGTNSTATNSVNFGWSTEVDGDFFVGPGADYNEVINPAGWGRIPEDNITGDIGNIDQPRDYPLPEYPDFPDNLPQQANINITGNQSALIDSDGFYDEISVLGNNNLYIQLDGGERVIRTKSLNIGQGHIILQGDGRLVLYVEDSFTLTGSSTINNDGASSATHMYYSGEQTVSVKGSTKFVGSMYIEKADLDLGGSNGVTGHIISGGSLVDIDGAAQADVRMLYAPNAHVRLGGSGVIRGAVVSKQFTAGGSATVFFDSDFEDSIPDLEDGDGTESFRVVSWH